MIGRVNPTYHSFFSVFVNLNINIKGVSMDVLDSKDLKRNPDLIKKKLKNIGDSIVTSVNLSILVYNKFVDKNMTILDNVCKVAGIIAIMDEDNNYGIMTIPGVFTIEPSSIDDVEIDGDHYYRLEVEKDDIFISDITIVKDTSFAFKTFNVLILSGNIPFFLGYEDLLNIFENLPNYAGTKLGIDTLPFEIFTAMVARDIKNPTKDYRTVVKTRNDLTKILPKWVGLQDIYYSFGSTLSKVAGSYFKTGTLAAIVNKNEKPTKLEKILKA